MSYFLCVLCGLSALVVAQDLERAPFSAASSVQQIDSVVLMRHAGYWETRYPEDERIYKYRVLVARSGTILFKPLGMEDAVERTFEIDPDSLEALFAAATRLELEDVPGNLSGNEPWCGVVTTDVHSVTIATYRGEDVHQVTDYQGCAVDEDASEQQLLSQLRQLEREAARLLGLERRFNAAPFIS